MLMDGGQPSLQKRRSGTAKVPKLMELGKLKQMELGDGLLCPFVLHLYQIVGPDLQHLQTTSWVWCQQPALTCTHTWVWAAARANFGWPFVCEPARFVEV
eukprot:4501855-Amphidinium_carterae.2